MGHICLLISVKTFCGHKLGELQIPYYVLICVHKLWVGTLSTHLIAEVHLSVK